MKMPPGVTIDEVEAAYAARDREIIKSIISGESVEAVAMKNGLLPPSIRRIMKAHGYRTKKKRQTAAESRRKNRVRRMTAALVASGKIPRMPCEVCGLVKSECHHDVYDLRDPARGVRWLCRQHHIARHKELGGLAWNRRSAFVAAAIEHEATARGTTPEAALDELEKRR